MSCAKDRSSGSILMSQAKLFLTSSLWPLPQLQDTSDLTECKASSQWSLRLYCVKNHLGGLLQTQFLVTPPESLIQHVGIRNLGFLKQVAYISL